MLFQKYQKNRLQNELKIKRKSFITGSTRGIGLAIAKNSIVMVPIIAINSRTTDSFENAKINFNEPIEFIKRDMTFEKSAKKAINTFIDKFNELDILICNIGSGEICGTIN